MSTPYRAGGPGSLRCASCGAERSADARVCTQCGAETPAVRCAACMTLVAIGEPACTACGAALEPEPEAEPTAQICARGCGPLSAFGDVLECERCGGIFVSHATLGAIVTAHRAHEKDHRTSINAPEPARDQVVYRPCPRCNNRMNRTVFGKSSGVIVDTCKDHGTWFDARELTASLAFVERGGLALVEKRERERKEEAARRAATEERVHKLDALNSPIVRGFDYERSAREESFRTLLDILLSL